jgi:aspartokinase-like uncharacterized kinase
MATLFSYCPESVQCLIAGFIPITGFVDGTFISVNKDEMPYSSVRMPDGTVARKYNNSQTYTITITLHNGAETNNLLTKMWQVDEITQRGKFPLLIKDQSGSDLLFSTESWIEGIPSLTKSNAIDSRVWVIKSAYAVINIGGNEEVSSLLNDITNIAVSALPGLGLF